MLKRYKIFQISSELNVGSVGRIAEQIGELVLEQGWESVIAYGRESKPSKSKTIKIGNGFDLIVHGVLTRVADRHGFASKRATEKLISEIESIKPDLIQLQHLHGYFINIEILFNYLAKINIPVVWTFHDCWSFTGHCTYYDMIGCEKWKEKCFSCPQKKEYPSSLIADNSYNNYLDKSKIFNSVDNLTIVPVSYWLGEQVKQSFLKSKRIRVIQNGIDLEKFSFKDNDVKKIFHIEDKFLILGVANPWDERKGLKYFIELSTKISNNDKIILIGLSKKQIQSLPKNILGLERTVDDYELARMYSAADVFVNTTLDEALGLTNIEALACGTPIITFDSGGSVEAVFEDTGFVVPKRDVEALVLAINCVKLKKKEVYHNLCRKKAENHFNKTDRFSEYIDLYKDLIVNV